MNDSIASRPNHAATASAARTSSRMIHPAPERRLVFRTVAWTTGGGLASARTSRIAPTDRSSAARVTADS